MLQRLTKTDNSGAMVLRLVWLVGYSSLLVILCTINPALAAAFVIWEILRLSFSKV